MISERNINKNNIKLGVVVKYVVVQFLQKKNNFCFDRNLLCFVSLYHPRSCLVLVAYDKINIPCIFLLISKLFTHVSIIFNSASRPSDIKQKDIEHLLIIIIIITIVIYLLIFIIYYFYFWHKRIYTYLQI